jgi:hypothetical protein
VFAPVTAASVRGVQPALNAAVTAEASLARWAAVSRQSGPIAVKNSPIDRPAALSVGGGRLVHARGGGGRFYARFLGRFGGNRCTP